MKEQKIMFKYCCTTEEKVSRNSDWENYYQFRVHPLALLRVNKSSQFSLPGHQSNCFNFIQLIKYTILNKNTNFIAHFASNILDEILNKRGQSQSFCRNSKRVNFKYIKNNIFGWAYGETDFRFRSVCEG